LSAALPVSHRFAALFYVSFEKEFKYSCQKPYCVLKHKPRINHKPKELLRLEAFSDGVFAIAITLLILELIQSMHFEEDVPLFRMMLMNWKYFLAFIIGFSTILVCWINHHLVVSYIERTDSKLFWVNGFVLFVVTFTPFPTAVLAEYLDKESRHALAFFGFNYVMMSVAAYCISAYIWKRSLRKSRNNLLHYYTLLYKYSIFYTLFAFGICFFSIAAAIVLYIILFVVFAFPHEFSLLLFDWKTEREKRR
jgi:uncharacterized membrane protein